MSNVIEIINCRSSIRKYSNKPLPEDICKTVIEAGLNRLRIMAISYAFSAFMDNAIAASRALGKSVVPMIFVFLGSCVFRIAWIYTVFAHYHTIQSLYLLYIFSWTLTAIAENIYFFRTFHRVMPARPAEKELTV